MSTHESPILSGKWDDNISWEFQLATELPDPSACAAVFCVALLPRSNQIVLTRSHRGWELLGGHIEPNETIEQALVRECLEEGGFTPEKYHMFGYRKLTAKERVAHQNQKGFYPFPHSYIPHYIAVSSQALQPPTGQEILESCTVPMHDLSILKPEHQAIVRAGLEAYAAAR